MVPAPRPAQRRPFPRPSHPAPCGTAREAGIRRRRTAPDPGTDGPAPPGRGNREAAFPVTRFRAAAPGGRTGSQGGRAATPGGAGCGKRAGDAGCCAALRHRSTGLGRHPEPVPGIRISRDAAPCGRSVSRQLECKPSGMRRRADPVAGTRRRCHAAAPDPGRVTVQGLRRPVTRVRVTPSHSESLRLLLYRWPGTGWVACV